MNDKRVKYSPFEIRESFLSVVDSKVVILSWSKTDEMWRVSVGGTDVAVRATKKSVRKVLNAVLVGDMPKRRIAYKWER